jgi:hypothetical protein
MKNYSSTIDRRNVSCSLGALAINVALTGLPIGIEQPSKSAAVDRQFLIINGWVLTREDMTESPVTIDVF